MANNYFNGAAYGIDETPYTEDDFVISIPTAMITIVINNGEEEAMQISFEEGDTIPMKKLPIPTPPIGKRFLGWSYNPEGELITDLFVKATTDMALFAIWGNANYENWTQLVNWENPIGIDKIEDIYKYQQRSTVYLLRDTNRYAIWNAYEYAPHEIIQPIIEVEILPKTEADNVIYHLVNKYEDTYWHYEYNVISHYGGLPNLGEDSPYYWKPIVLSSVDVPTLQQNLTEVVYKTDDKKTYYYNEASETWMPQNSLVHGLWASSDNEILITDILSVPIPTSSQWYKLYNNIDGYVHYNWARLIKANTVDPGYNPGSNPIEEADVATELLYWVIDQDRILYISGYPITNIVSASPYPNQYKGVIEMKYAHIGPYNDYSSDFWGRYNTEITEAYILDHIAPQYLMHWFFNCKKLTAVHGLEKLHMDYARDITAMFAGCDILTELPGIENWNTESVERMSNIFMNCYDIKELNLSNWNTHSVTRSEDGRNCFTKIFNMEHIYVGDKWTLSDSLLFDANYQKLHNYPSKVFRIDDGKNNGVFEKKYMIQFNQNGGKSHMPNQYSSGTILDPPSEFKLPICTIVPPEGKSFKGWAYSPSLDPISTSTILIDEDITLYPIWK